MFTFSKQQYKKALVWLVFFHILIIASSNYLVQLPMNVLGFHSTWGALSFPFIFLATDLTVRIFGAMLARRIVFFRPGVRGRRPGRLAGTALRPGLPCAG